MSTQEQQIVQAFSSINIPNRIFRESKVKELIHDINTESKNTQSKNQRLKRLRKEKSDGNFVSNWWNGQDDKIQEAQLDLSATIGKLTQKSSQLLVVNTAISKVLSDQQNLLLQQQAMLKQQADKLESQNQQILDQQIQLGQQQEAINAANKGLMEAKGLTQEQALQLVGCVKRVTEAEERMDAANQALRDDIEQNLIEASREFQVRLSSGFDELHQQQKKNEKILTDAFSTQSKHNQSQLAQFSASNDAFQTEITQTLQQQNDSLQERTFLQNDRISKLAAESGGFKIEMERQHQAYTQATQERLDTHERSLQQQMEELSTTLHTALNMQVGNVSLGLEQQLTTVTTNNNKRLGRQRLAIAGTALLALGSLGLQAAIHWALI
ncbi:hypothetical protein [Salinicola peritrichatus]|uniref:hypothetical protein n=1 Tax=Salinicola peritrichatus TaxID=1267424 RepID=UPI000DA1C2DF|nr:hypothetical protein [Salinicola peritrichatus]